MVNNLKNILKQSIFFYINHTGLSHAPNYLRKAAGIKVFLKWE